MDCLWKEQYLQLELCKVRQRIALLTESEKIGAKGNCQEKVILSLTNAKWLQIAPIGLSRLPLNQTILPWALNAT